MVHELMTAHVLIIMIAGNYRWLNIRMMDASIRRGLPDSLFNKTHTLLAVMIFF